LISLSAGQCGVARIMETQGGTLTAGLVKSTGFGRDSRFELLPDLLANSREQSWQAASRSAYFGEGS
jgi:hypothetical protein